jgi:hypothetical protein
VRSRTPGSIPLLDLIGCTAAESNPLGGKMNLAEGTDFFENGLSFYCHLAKQELHEYIVFHTETERSWQEKDRQLQTQLESILEKYPASDHHEIVESHGWELHLNQYRYPDIHRTALVVALFIFLEDQLNGLCQTIGESIDSKVSLRDVRGQGTERALTYLAKVAEFEFGAVPSLGFVRDVRRLRNQLVHAGGILPDGENDTLNRFVRDQEGLSGHPGQRVRVSASFIEELAVRLVEFFDQLDGQVQHFMRRVSA